MKKLRALTQVALGAEMIKLQRIVLAEEEKLGQIKCLQESGSERLASLTIKGGVDIALYAGADKRWAIWQQSKIAELNTERAAQIAAKSVQLIETQKAFSKDEAVRHLVDTKLEAERLKLYRQ